MAFSIVLLPFFSFLPQYLLNEFMLENYFYPIELFFMELLAGFIVFSLCHLDRSFSFKE